jgi:hypothetical protein
MNEWRRNQPPPLNLDKFCSRGYSPGYNGGISLRNKTWLLRAIDACPHETRVQVFLFRDGHVSYGKRL